MTHTDHFIKGFKAGLQRRLLGRAVQGSRTANDEFRMGRSAGCRLYRDLVENAIANDRLDDLDKFVADVISCIDAGDTRALDA